MLSALMLWLPLVGMLFGGAVVWWLCYWLLLGRYAELAKERKFARQLILLGIALLGLLACILVLPIKDSSRNQLLGLTGILLSGLLAFSSTTIISNLMAGLLIRITKPFRVGDYIRVGEHVGRVTEQGLFDTEIQTETRELIALPNTFCISQPVVTTRSSGTIIAATLSLGYELQHQRVEQLLIKAATACGLTEPFVHIIELGNFAVTYKVSGFLEDSKRLITMQSNLYGAVLDTLHQQKIEIMSPSYMNQRVVTSVAIPDQQVQMMPQSKKSAQNTVEEIVFDKAEQAEAIEKHRFALEQQIKKVRQALEQATKPQTEALQLQLEKLEAQLKATLSAVVNETTG